MKFALALNSTVMFCVLCDLSLDIMSVSHFNSFIVVIVVTHCGGIIFAST